MSRIGKKCIMLAKAINTTIADSTITVEGPKGKLSHKIHDLINISLDNDKSSSNQIIVVKPKNSTKQAQQLHGLSRTLINNMVIGVTEGFTKYLEIQGVGYRSQMDGRKLVLNVGYSLSLIHI